MRKHDELTHQKGETLSDSQRVYQVKVVETFLCAKVPFSKLEIFKELLEDTAFQLSDSRHARVCAIYPG